MKLLLIASSLLLALFSNTVLSAEYIYRDLMANTLPSIRCESPEKAQKSATKPYKIKRSVKKFCQTQGYGWGIQEVKNDGKVVCNECSDNASLQVCHVEDMIVNCKRLKPGSVGMLPGQG